MHFISTFLICLIFTTGISRAQEPTHGLSLFGTPALEKKLRALPLRKPASP